MPDNKLSDNSVSDLEIRLKTEMNKFLGSVKFMVTHDDYSDLCIHNAVTNRDKDLIVTIDGIKHPSDLIEGDLVLTAGEVGNSTTEIN